MTRKNMLRIVTMLAISLCLVITLAGCGGGSSGESESSEESAAAEETVQEERNGFDKETNQKITIGNMMFSVPEYLAEKEGSTESNITLTENSSMMRLQIVSVEMEGKLDQFGSEEQASAVNGMLDNMDGIELGDLQTGQEAGGLPTVLFTCSGAINDAPVSGKGAVLYNEGFDTMVALLLVQTDSSPYSYFGDFDKIVQSAKADKKPKVSKEFKKTMDKYEDFIDEYVKFMKSYQDSDDVMGMLNDYTEYMSKYQEVMDGLNSIDEDELSDADLAYYLEVNSRISKKLLEAAG